MCSSDLQCVFYNSQCGLCDAGYVGYTRGHLHDLVKGNQQQSSAIAKQMKECAWDISVYEMLFTRTLSKAKSQQLQSDSIHAELFS